MMTSTKKSENLGYYFGVFWKILCSTSSIHAKFHNQGFNDSGFMSGDPFAPSQGSWMSKGPAWFGLTCSNHYCQNIIINGSAIMMNFFKTFTLNHDLCITSINASDFFIKPHNGMKCYPTSTW